MSLAAHKIKTFECETSEYRLEIRISTVNIKLRQIFFFYFYAYRKYMHCDDKSMIA